MGNSDRIRCPQCQSQVKREDGPQFGAQHYHCITKNCQHTFKLWKRTKLPIIPKRGCYTGESLQKRLEFIRAETNAELKKITDISMDPLTLIGNIESLIGSVEIPVGLAGPLLIEGESARGLFYAPLATTEGALVSSAIRGSKAVSLAGGVKTCVLEQRMMRVPLFVFENIEQAIFFADWLMRNYTEIEEQNRRYSNYAKLKEIDPQIIGKQVHVHFIYKTGDAAGQNMTTTCTWQTCQWIIEKISAFGKIRLNSFLIDANLSNDKKVSFHSFIKGRGIRVVSEALLPASITRRVLKVTPEQLVRAYHHFMTGTVAAGNIGFNINFSNIIASIFTATGQDIACVHESSIGQLHMEQTENNEIYVSVLLPSLIIGTVGGGTQLPRQYEFLNMMHCAGRGTVKKLAEIIAGFCLALDISTLSAIASDQFARSHEKLGRNRPVDWLKLADFDSAFFLKALQQHYQSSKITVKQCELLKDVKLGSSIITELTSHKFDNKLIGHLPYRIRYINYDGVQRQEDMLLKVKPLDDEVILMVNSMASMCHPDLAKEFNRFKKRIGFEKCHVRELSVMSQKDPRFTRYAPIIYWVYQKRNREAYVLVEEYLTDVLLMDCADDISDWTSDYIYAALEGIANIHSIWYRQEKKLKQQNWLGEYPTKENMVEKKRLWEMLAVHAAEEFDWYQLENIHLEIIRNLDDWWEIIDEMPKTLIHNDFNPRNITFRKTSDGPVLCCYDWELATIHLPQHDLAELLVFTMTRQTTQEEIKKYIEYHRHMLSKACNTEIDAKQWMTGYKHCLRDLMINRISMYLMAHTFRHYGFMRRVVKTLHHLLSISDEMT